MQSIGAPGSLLSEILIVNFDPGSRIQVILVPETIGF